MPKLPLPLLSRRLQQELEDCKRETSHYVGVLDPTFTKFDAEVTVTLMNTPGPVLVGDKVRHKYTHKVLLVLSDEYPYAKPNVRWKSEIFHPNIMMPEDGGYVCTKLLDDWRYDSTLLSFVKGLETLLRTPNPDSPYATDSCMQAAAHFAHNPYKPPEILAERERRRPSIVAEDKEG